MTDNLRTRIVSTAISNLCLLCGRHGKTVDHLSFIVIIDNLSFIVIIPMFCGTAWKLIPFAILWLVSKERTSRIIRGASCLWMMFAFATTRIATWLSSRSKFDTIRVDRLLHIWGATLMSRSELLSSPQRCDEIYSRQSG